jgi:transposase
VDRIAALEQKLVELLRENGRLREELAAALGVIALLEQDNADLRAQLAKNSGNSGKPPSSDGLKKPPRVARSLRGRSGKKSGGQVGHKGASLQPVETPDKIETHEATQCAHCKGALTSAMATGVETRQVFDIPDPRLEVTEHRAAIYCCAHCQGVTRAAFPEAVTGKTQYGPRFRQTAVYYNAGQLIPEDRVVQIMRDLHGAASLCSASVVNWVNAKAEAMDAVVAHILSRLTVGGVRHLDETGLRVAGKLHWLHSVSNAGRLHPLPGERDARRCACVSGRRDHRPRSLQAVLRPHQRRGCARSVRRPSPAGTEGHHGDRRGAVGGAVGGADGGSVDRPEPHETRGHGPR